MSNSVIQYAYVSGELSPTLYSRTDLEKYDLGLAIARNWIVDYRGGISTRPGSIYCDWLQHPLDPIRWFPFEFSQNVANTNIVVFGNTYIRFLQEGTYVLEADKTVTALTIASSAVVTANAHGFVNGELVKFTALSGPVELLGRTFVVTNVTTNTFRLQDQFGLAVSTVGFSPFVSGTVARVYTLASPFAVEDLAEINCEQIRDTLRFTHYKYPTYDLARTGPASWTMTETLFSVQVPRPENLDGSPSLAGTAGVAFCVTAVDHSGNESLPSDIFIETASVNYATTAGSYNLAWTPVVGAAYYNVYRSTILSNGSHMTKAAQLGYLGRAYGAFFVDTNIIPDFTRLPPQYNNPFSNGAILWIDILSGGAGYNQGSSLVITDPTGSGFAGYLVVNEAGSIVGVQVTQQGKGYSSPTVNAGGGSGAVFSVHLSEATGNYPATSAVFQQRQVYAGTSNRPLGLWGSQPKRYNNFDVSAVLIDKDSYDFELDANKVAMIKHLLPMRGGLLVMNETGIWQLTGGNNVAVTPTNALAEPQSYTGVSVLSPLRIETDILYVESKGYTVRLMSYNDLSKLYAGTDISILSAHFFGAGKEIVSWTFAQEPYKLVHGARADGYRLTGTLIKEQNIYAWTLASTKGLYKQVLTIREDKFDRVYFDVLRQINGAMVRYVELEAARDFEIIEEAWCVDAGLELPPTYLDTTLQFSAATGTAQAVTGAAVWTADSVGDIIFGGGAKAKVTAYVSPTEVTVLFLRPMLKLWPETDQPQPLLPGEWTRDEPTTTVKGLYHLEGEEVAILADGSVQPPRTVVNGQLTLDTPCVRAIIGLGFQAVARTLPLTASGAAIEGKRKRVVGVIPRVYESRGLKAGARLDHLYEMKDRTTENYGQPILPRSDMVYQSLEPEWNEDGQTYYVVDDPLPVTLLGHVTELELGDDPE